MATGSFFALTSRVVGGSHFDRSSTLIDSTIARDSGVLLGEVTLSTGAATHKDRNNIHITYSTHQGTGADTLHSYCMYMQYVVTNIPITDVRGRLVNSFYCVHVQ